MMHVSWDNPLVVKGFKLKEFILEWSMLINGSLSCHLPIVRRLKPHSTVLCIYRVLTILYPGKMSADVVRVCRLLSGKLAVVASTRTGSPGQVTE